MLDELSGAKNPLIIARGDTEGQVGALITQIAQENSIAVSEVFVTRNLLATDFDLNIGVKLPRISLMLMLLSSMHLLRGLPLSKATVGAKIIHLGQTPI